MSTRANVIIEAKGSWGGTSYVNRLYFYRHSDGYPEGVMPTLNKFIEWLKADKIRNNLTQSAGWLVVLGAMEYSSIPDYEKEKPFKTSDREYGKPETFKEPTFWKVGAFEPTTGLHGDIEYLYVIDLANKEIKEVPEKKWKEYEIN